MAYLNIQNNFKYKLSVDMIANYCLLHELKTDFTCTVKFY